jgi:thioredoxin reductase (NADPH)
MPKPVILTVDDDPEVLGAIERDLRQQYRNDYRIIKANGGKEALEAVQQLKKRGTPIALFIVDQRMPEMTGTEFLREAVKLYPDACKTLLTAYADTEAAIESINEIGLDHYLMKPWDPPEQKLYPVLDDLLSKWSMSVRLPYDGIRVAGARWSPASYAVKEFMSRNQVPYQWIDIDEDEATRELIAPLSEGLKKLPIILFPDGSIMVAPSVYELAEKAGLKTKAALPFYDLAIIGGGPAGLANAVYGASEGLSTVLIEQGAPGGQAGTSSRIENYLGFPSGITGADLAQRATAQARRFGAELLSQEVVGIEREDPYRIIKLSDGSKISAYSVLISTGMNVRKLEVPGIDELQGIGVYYGAAMTEALTYRDQHVCVVGGANSAGQGALFFARYAKKVTMLVRSPLKKSMSQYLIDRIEATPNIEVMNDVDVASVSGNNKLEQVSVKNHVTGEVRSLDAAGMFIFIGFAPRSEMVNGVIECDEKGFIRTGPDLPRTARGIKGWTLDRDPFLFETNVPGVFAAGDIRYGANRRVAAAVGEGSAAIYTIKKYLEMV